MVMCCVGLMPINTLRARTMRRRYWVAFLGCRHGSSCMLAVRSSGPYRPCRGSGVVTIPSRTPQRAGLPYCRLCRRPFAVLAPRVAYIMDGPSSASAQAGDNYRALKVFAMDSQCSASWEQKAKTSNVSDSELGLPYVTVVTHTVAVFHGTWTPRLVEVPDARSTPRGQRDSSSRAT